MERPITREEFEQWLTTELAAAGRTPKNATDEEFYHATATVVRRILKEKRARFRADYQAKGRKQIYYMSMEFLLGRSLKNAIYNLGIQDIVSAVLKSHGAKMENIFEQEPDAGLGNGGLGRLAACYMDALATLEYPAMGYSILYEYGIFKQKIIDGWQTEQPDNWLPGGKVWLEEVPDHSVEVHFGGQIEEYWDLGYHHVQHRNYSAVKAVPYDIMISGYDSKGVSVLRLWTAQSAAFDMESFNPGDYASALSQNANAEVISKILYPNDNHPQGKELRLKQQYFLVAASMHDIIRRHVTTYGNIDNFAEKNAIHINDTHPTLAIPELMRILLDEFSYSWERAWGIVTRTFAYTNHTVMSEALECWNEDMFRNLLPRIYQIVKEIDRRWKERLYNQEHLDGYTVSRMAVIDHHQIRMANLSVVGSHSTNGVSALHSQILKDDVLHDFYRIDPNKFQNVTNGIASRRWLYQSNPRLNDLCIQLIGEGFMKDQQQLCQLRRFEEDESVLAELGRIKQANKEDFARYIKKLTGQVIDPNSIFDVQVKRLHEYKRQHLNAMQILNLYNEIKENPNGDWQPVTFIFGAKAAPGYYLAKQIIKFICSLGHMIQNDPQVKDLLNIVYLEDYRVTLSELLMPASEISEQISLAGTEASGTGNMKLMLNGALTLGTWDGANVEIGQHVGPENIFIFGMDTPQVNQLKEMGYNPFEIYSKHPQLHRAIDMLSSGEIDGDSFEPLADSLKFQDPYMVLQDFDSYDQTRRQLFAAYRDQKHWQKMALVNTAEAGYFCADRAIQEYAKKIWGL